MTAFTVIYNVLAYSAGTFSVLMNVSPLITIRKLEQSGTVGPTTITFYGAQMYSAVSWASYGVYIWAFPILISNVLGNFVSTYCSLVFLTMARQEERAGRRLQATTYLTSLLTSAGFLALVWVHLLVSIILIMNGRVETARTLAGYEGSVASILMLSAPLGMFKTIIATKNAESLAPLTITFAFLNTLLWIIAGLMVRDPFLIIPNILCWLACVAQYILLFLYGRKGLGKGGEIHEAIAPVPFD